MAELIKRRFSGTSKVHVRPSPNKIAPKEATDLPITTQSTSSFERTTEIEDGVCSNFEIGDDEMWINSNFYDIIYIYRSID